MKLKPMNPLVNHDISMKLILISRDNGALCGFWGPGEFMDFKNQLYKEIDKLMIWMDRLLQSGSGGDLVTQCRQLISGILRLKNLADEFASKKINKERADENYKTAIEKFDGARLCLIRELEEMKYSGKISLLHGDILQILKKSAE